MFSVVVPAYNAESTIGSCLEALLNQSVPREQYEIIVVDDGSTDGTALVVRKYPVRLIQQENLGPAAARNVGVQEATGTILLFTDADCEPTAAWVECLAGAIQGEVVGAKGAYLTRQQGLVPRLVQAEYEDKYEHLKKSRYIDHVDTYSAAYRREVFLENGGFDAGITTPSVEDQELSFRLAEQGYRMVFVPQAIVYHRHPATLRRYWKRKYHIGYWKAYLHRTHPQELVSDSHTPFSLRLQILLLGAALLFLAAGVLARPLLWGIVLALGLFVGSVMPFSISVAGKGGVALIAPLAFALRALALVAGFAAGTIRFRAGALRSGLARASKRAVDLLGAAIALLVCLPLWLAIAIWIKRDSSGPVLFVQERVGENGRLFRMYKFRSMFHNSTNSASDELEELRLRQPNFKLKDDPRVTTSGRFLRRTSLDELPQLINVVKGDLSLVGPRPEEPKVVSRYNHWHRQRLLVKPGITGPMQVNGRGDLPLDEWVHLELAYIRDPSPWKDLVILLKTIPAVVRGRGAY